MKTLEVKKIITKQYKFFTPRKGAQIRFLPEEENKDFYSYFATNIKTDLVKLRVSKSKGCVVCGE